MTAKPSLSFVRSRTGFAAREARGLAEGRPVRCGDDHLVARAEQRAAGEVEGLLAPDRDGHLLGGEGGAEVGAVAIGDGRSQLGHPRGGRVLGPPRVEGPLGRGHHVGRRRLIGLADAEIQDVLPRSSARGRALGHRHRGRNLQRARGARKVRGRSRPPAHSVSPVMLKPAHGPALALFIRSPLTSSRPLLLRSQRTAWRYSSVRRSPLAQTPSPRSHPILLAKPRFHDRRHQIGHPSPELEDLLDQPRGQVRVALGGHHEDRLDAGIEAPIHERHLELVLEVREGPDAPHDHRGPHLPRVAHEQAGEGVDADPGLALVGLADEVHPLLDREERLLLRVDQDGHPDPIEHVEAAGDDVEVAVRDGVERARKDGERPARSPGHRFWSSRR